MPAKRKHPGGRPSKGLGETQLPLRMPETLREHAERAAKREGVTLAEWIRRAIRDRVLRQEAERLRML